MSIMMEYLRQLQKNNQRDWFQSHKELRKEAEAEFEELLQDLMERIARFDPLYKRLFAKRADLQAGARHPFRVRIKLRICLHFAHIFPQRGSFPYRLDIMFI